MSGAFQEVEISQEHREIATLHNAGFAEKLGHEGTPEYKIVKVFEQVVAGKLSLEKIDLGSPYTFRLQRVAIRELDDAALETLSKTGQLYLTLPEMKTIQEHVSLQARMPMETCRCS